MEDWSSSSGESASPWNTLRYNVFHIVLPDGLTSIGEYAFSYFDNVSEIVIPDTVTEIGYRAFSNCTDLTTVTMSESLTRIEDYAFTNCNSLSQLELPEGLNRIGDYAFSGCSVLNSISIPDSVTYIGEDAFEYCTALSEVKLPANLNTISEYLFYKCTSLTSIDIPASTKNIERYAFSGCSLLSEINYEGNDINIGSSALVDTAWLSEKKQENPLVILGDTLVDATEYAESSLTIPETVKKIGSYAFEGNETLVSIVLPETVTAIESSAFYECVNLTDITVKNPYCQIYSSSYTLPSGATIYGFADSTAQTYADSYEHTFVALTEERPSLGSYEITPIMEPFGDYFYVKTDNLDPDSFRFVDKETKYSSDGTNEISLNSALYADVVYEDPSIYRVNGGYIFYGGYTDGGDVCLQIRDKLNGTWIDTDVVYTLPELMDTVDYLIENYATEDSFFDNMDAVESGFNSICLYSGSYIRGEVYRAGENWYIHTSPHIDQSLYIDSPYYRKDNLTLFASRLYPIMYDSLGFPSIMGRVAMKLDETAEYEWSETSHSRINVTYNGETRSYGGAGNGDGQGIDLDDIRHYFTFSEGETEFTLKDSKKLLDSYSSMEIADDVPHEEDELTLEKLVDTVGEDGAWVRLVGVASIFGGTYTTYSYLYKENDSYNFSTTEIDPGGFLYWWGSLGYASDMWVDGRYVDSYEEFEPGAEFSDHPTSDIMLTQEALPEITYSYTSEYNSDSGQYERRYKDVKVTNKVHRVIFEYNEDTNTWNAPQYDIASELAQAGEIGEEFADMLQLTYDEVVEMGADKNSKTLPQSGFLYDDSAAAGTPFTYTQEEQVIPGLQTTSTTATTAETETTTTETTTTAIPRPDDPDETIDGQQIASVCLGDGHSAAITEDGDLYLWGDNQYGQLGNGTTENSDVPVKVMNDVAFVSLGKSHSAAITKNGTLYTWGSNYYGQLGNGTSEHSSLPVPIMSNVKAVALGNDFTAALLNDGRLYMWGYNGESQIAGFSEYSLYNPVKVMGNVASVSVAGNNTAVVTDDGILYTWGSNSYGELGNGTDTPTDEKVKVMENVKDVELGNCFGSAITTDSSLYMWGKNYYGQLGDGTDTDCFTPVKVMDDVTQVSLGGNHSAAINKDGSLYIWGCNLYGQLGTNSRIDSYSPVKILDNVKSVNLGFSHSAVISEGGDLYIWGDNREGQIGNGDYSDQKTPYKIAGTANDITLEDMTTTTTTTATTTTTTTTTTETETTTPETETTTSASSAVEKTAGDVNGDNAVNIADVVLIRRYILSPDSSLIDETNADMDGDGIVNIKDVVLIRRYMLNND